MKPILIGQAPGRRGNGEPLSGMAGRRLSALCGLDLRTFLETFDRTNVLPAFPGRAGRGDYFPVAQARPAAEAMRPTLRGRTVVLLGWNVARAFRHTGRLHVWEDGWAIAAHPSGCSAYWNDPDNVKSAQAFWTELARIRE